jgi:hypothetical protein
VLTTGPVLGSANGEPYRSEQRTIHMLQLLHCSMVSCTAPELTGDYWGREYAVGCTASVFFVRPDRDGDVRHRAAKQILLRGARAPEQLTIRFPLSDSADGCGDGWSGRLRLRAVERAIACAQSQKKTAGPRPRRLTLYRCLLDQNNCNTFWSACAASDRATVESCWRVFRASMFAPSSFVSARTRLSAPICRTLIMFFVKS